MTTDTSSRFRFGKILAGLVFITVGVILLLKQLGYYFPAWLISWPMLLIVIGLVLGAQQGFRNPGWIIVTAIGSVFLLDNLYPYAGILRFIWPVAIIGAGLLMIFSRHHPCKHRRWKQERLHQKEQSFVPTTASENDHAESIEAVAVFGGIKKTVFSKNFTGGEVVAFMGGVEINLTHADIQGRVRLEVTQVLGGTKLIVPSHWDVISEMSAVLGGIDDKRMPPPGAIDKGKVLVIEGTSILGGIEIQSYV